MKTTLMKTAIALMSTMVIGSVAKAATPLDGTWKLVNRYCNNGQPTDDNFKLGRDSAIYKIEGGMLQAELTVEGRSYYSTYRFVYDAPKMILENLYEKQEPEVGYAVLNSKNQLVFVSSPHFKQGGTCAVGSQLSTVLEKQ